MPASSAAADTNVVETLAAARPIAPQSGPYRVGSAPWTLALPSPIALQATMPPLKTITGFTPKDDASHRTRSATRPGEREPTSCEMPWTRAGSSVTFAR